MTDLDRMNKMNGIIPFIRLILSEKSHPFPLAKLGYSVIPPSMKSVVPVT